MLEAKVIVGDNRHTLSQLPENSIQTVVTSPPYWGLRDYGTQSWSGGDDACDHVADETKTKKFGNEEFNKNRPSREATKTKGYYYEGACGNCGAIQQDSQIGLEQTPDEFIEQLCLVFDEVWRVLKDDGTIWVNLGDSYAGSGKGSFGNFGKHAPSGSARHLEHSHSGIVPDGLKPKDLVGIPWRFAFAMQARGWYLRQDIIWAKPNPMPESVTDRCTKSHEYIFLLTKSSKYHYDHEAIKEPIADSSTKRLSQNVEDQEGSIRANGGAKTNGNMKAVGNLDLRNKRSVWSVNVKGYKEAHFATYPPELILPCILAGSKEEDTVLDPFSGSGTTGEVALRNDRNYIGLELSGEYAAISEKRLTDAIGMLGNVTIE